RDGLEPSAMDDTTQPIGPPPRPSLPDAPPPPLASRLLRMVVVGTVGLVLLVAGLAWDAVLHARDPGLAAAEGVFAPTNPRARARRGRDRPGGGRPGRCPGHPSARPPGCPGRLRAGQARPRCRR